MSLYADVIVNISHENLDRSFQYRIPEKLEGVIYVGSRVEIPFGKGDRSITGYVLDITDKPKIDENKIKDIKLMLTQNDLVEQKLISLAYFIKNRYGSTMNHALKTVLPVKKDVKKSLRKSIILNIPGNEAGDLLAEFERKHQLARYRLLKELINEESLDYALVTKKLNISPATIKYFAEKEFIRIEEERVYRSSLPFNPNIERKSLLPKQQAILDDFAADYEKGIRGEYLLFGVTGSGKTEVYMEMIELCIKKGRSCIVLIPEIALTYQTVLRFHKRFGDRVSTLHSRLSEGEKYDQFERAKKHEIDIMIGPRSALFTPFDNLGLIVIDEEHEHSYKSDKMPKYHARQVARQLALLHNASLVLGSATPDVTSFYEAQNGSMKLYELDERAKSSKMPTVEIVDLKSELKSGNKSIFSESLRNKMSDRLLKGEQVMLFLNRRGYAGFVSCRSCGEAVKCPHCDVSLTSHRDGRLHCHYCGYERDVVRVCDKCGSNLIGGMRAGTEAVEEAVKKIFPFAKVLRMDKDTTKQKDDYESILSSFANREADILVGTQMIVKGHDFPYVTLVGILAADMSLNGSDYKASERTFQLIVQAAGRAGRAEREGEVIIQTYQPDNYAILAASKQNYKEFYEQELAYRSLMHYPPMGHMMAVLIESDEEQKGQKFADSLAEKIKDAIIRQAVCIGPAAATLKKISDIYRFVIYVKARELEILVAVKDLCEDMDRAAGIKGTRISFDLDPENGY